MQGSPGAAGARLRAPQGVRPFGHTEDQTVALLTTVLRGESVTLRDALKSALGHTSTGAAWGASSEVAQKQECNELLEHAFPETISAFLSASYPNSPDMAYPPHIRFWKSGYEADGLISSISAPYPLSFKFKNRFFKLSPTTLVKIILKHVSVHSSVS